MAVREFRIAGDDPTNFDEALPTETYFNVKPNIKFPKEYYKYFDKTVIGQEEAKQALSTALFETQMRSRHDSKDKHPRLLLVGPTGCGKTMLIKSLSQLSEFITIVIDASQLTGDGWSGDTKFKKEFLNQLTFSLSVQYKGEIPADVFATLSERIILVFDEFDKLSEHKATHSHYDYKKIIQDELLMFIDGVNFPLTGRYMLTVNEIPYLPTLDTSKFLVVVAGAFQSLHNQSKSNPMGFFTQPNLSELKKIDKNTLEEHGIMREMLGRIDRVINLNPLSADSYKAILKEQILPEYIAIFNEANIHPVFNDSWIDSVIDKCMNKLEGARALREIVQDLLAPYIFNIEDYADTVVIDSGVQNVKVQIN